MTFQLMKSKPFFDLASHESVFIFNNEVYQQKDGVAMGSSLGPSFANVFLCHHEEIIMVSTYLAGRRLGSSCCFSSCCWGDTPRPSLHRLLPTNIHVFLYLFYEIRT